MPRKNTTATEETTAEILNRIEETSELLDAMLTELKRRGANKKLLSRAETHLNLGIIAAAWSLDDAFQSPETLN